MATAKTSKNPSFINDPLSVPKPVAAGPNVGYTRPEVTALMDKWDLVEDCMQGEHAVKARADLYLPRPNPTDTSVENTARYDQYLARAVFYNVTKRTLDGLVGQVFSRDPIIEMPNDSMQVLIANADGEGVSLDQQAKKSLSATLGFGRVGLLVDYPITVGPTTVAQMKNGEIHAVVKQYMPKSIINWRHITRGAKKILSLVVLKEESGVSDDGFEITNKNQWRVLQLIGDVYTVTTWEQNEETEFFEETGRFVPKDSKGVPFNEIPFFFVGVMNNDASPDLPMLYDLAVLNIAHYRNSAEYEDSCYMVGQPTPFFAGLTEKWVKDVFKGTIHLGSRAAIALPQGATAGLLQVAPNSMPFEAMGHKEGQMIALGAKLIEQNNVSQTLGETQIDESSEASVLATAAKNVSAAYSAALKICARMMGVPDKDVTYSLNTDFPASRLTPNERNQLILEWQAGAITRTEMRAGMRKAGVAILDTDDYKKELESDPPPNEVAAERDAELAKAAMENRGKGGADNKKKTNDPENNGGNQNGV